MSSVPSSSSPALRHLALIMDGNGRWALKRGRKRIFGHIQGLKAAKAIIPYCSQKGIAFLSLFALSAENIQRPAREVQGLKNLLKKALLAHSKLLMQERIKLHIIGDLSVFSSDLKEICQKLCEQTREHRGMNLILALNYSGRNEISQVIRDIASQVQNQRLKASELNEERISSFFPSSDYPPPDLIIRTGGRVRLSNFYLWSSAYSELHFSKLLWPDFSPKQLEKALASFSPSDRKFGKL